MECLEGRENDSIFDTWNRIAKSLDSDKVESVYSTEGSCDWARSEIAERSLACQFGMWQFLHLRIPVEI